MYSLYLNIALPLKIQAPLVWMSLLFDQSKICDCLDIASGPAIEAEFENANHIWICQITQGLLNILFNLSNIYVN